MGYVTGRYYDAKGKPTTALKKAQSVIQAGRREAQDDDDDNTRYPSCNSRWSQGGGEVWCSTLSGGVRREWEGVPRQYHKPRTAGAGGEVRCVCVRSAKEAGGNPNMKPYPGCDLDATLCKT